MCLSMWSTKHSWVFSRHINGTTEAAATPNNKNLPLDLQPKNTAVGPQPGAWISVRAPGVLFLPRPSALPLPSLSWQTNRRRAFRGLEREERHKVGLSGLMSFFLFMAPWFEWCFRFHKVVWSFCWRGLLWTYTSYLWWYCCESTWQLWS